MPGELTIQRLLLKMGEIEASDLHIKIGSPPVMRIASVLHKIESPDLSSDDTKQLLMPIVPEYLRSALDERGGVDFSHHEDAEQRFRCSVFHAGGGLHAAIRRVNPKVPDFEELNLPPIYRQISDQSHEGLVIVCGVTGSGKSSTLAAMIDHINAERPCNILTIEDPGGVSLPAAQVVREPARDRHRRARLPDTRCARRPPGPRRHHDRRAARPRDDVGGPQAAETGHTCSSTLHTADTMQSFARILEFFPSKEHAVHPLQPGQRPQGGHGPAAPAVGEGRRPDRVPATEVLLNTPTVQDKIREGEDEDLPAIMHGSIAEGMHDFTSSLADLVEGDWVDLKTAEKYAPNAEALRSKVRGIEVKADMLVSRVKS